MPLGPFPDPRQIKVLSFLHRNYGGSSKPVDGPDGRNISTQLGITYDELRPLISDLEERGYVRTGCKTRGNIIGQVAISSAGRDLVNETANTARNLKQLNLEADANAESEGKTMLDARDKKRRVFVIHGRNAAVRDFVFGFLWGAPHCQDQKESWIS